MNGIQRALAINPYPSLIHLESQLLKDLDVVCGQETELWALKARINWLVLGDRNTSFYHISALTRRKRNLITSVKNGAGDWIMEERGVMNFFREGFYKLYTTAQELASGNFSYNSHWQAKISEEESASISHLVTEEEIFAALWSLKAFKAPRLDGLHAGFFQRFWITVGDSVREEVKKAYRERKIPKYLNNTSIVLIPKVQGPESIGNYRPISLCNSIYKIISKVLVGRIRPLLDRIISPYQAAFVPDRKGVDNAIIV